MALLFILKGEKEVEMFYKYLTIFFGAVVGFLGGLDEISTALLILIVIDYVSGIIAAALHGELKSKVGFRGIAKKVFILFLVAAAHVIDGVIGTNAMFREAVIFFFIANELLSLIENAGKIGLPVPGILEKAVESLKSKGGDSK